MIEDVCLECIQKAENLAMVRGDAPFLACVVYRADEPHRWLRLVNECPKLKDALRQIDEIYNQIIENSDAIEAEVRRREGLRWLD